MSKRRAYPQPQYAISQDQAPATPPVGASAAYGVPQVAQQVQQMNSLVPNLEPLFLKVTAITSMVNNLNRAKLTILTNSLRKLIRVLEDNNKLLCNSLTNSREAILELELEVRLHQLSHLISFILLIFRGNFRHQLAICLYLLLHL